MLDGKMLIPLVLVGTFVVKGDFLGIRGQGRGEKVESGLDQGGGAEGIASQPNSTASLASSREIKIQNHKRHEKKKKKNSKP